MLFPGFLSHRLGFTRGPFSLYQRKMPSRKENPSAQLDLLVRAGGVRSIFYDMDTRYATAVGMNKYRTRMEYDMVKQITPEWSTRTPVLQYSVGELGTL